MKDTTRWPKLEHRNAVWSVTEKRRSLTKTMKHTLCQQDRSGTCCKDLWNTELFPHSGCLVNDMGVTEAVEGARKEDCLSKMFCIYGRHSMTVWQTLRDEISCGHGSGHSRACGSDIDCSKMWSKNILGYCDFNLNDLQTLLQIWKLNIWKGGNHHSSAMGIDYAYRN